MHWLFLFALQARAGTLSTVDVFKVCQAFETETSYTVWSDLTTNLATPLLLAQHTDFDDNTKSFMRKLFSPVHQSLGWDPKPGEGTTFNPPSV